MSDPISIVIPAYNELGYCKQCIDSIRANTERAYRLILVDNGSTDGVSEYFDAVPGAEVIHNERNLGFAAGVNKGLAIATGHVVLLNSDTIVPAGWLARLEKCLLSAKEIGMVGPVTNEASGEQRIEAPKLESVDEINRFAALHALAHKDEVSEVARLVGFCLLIRDEVVRDVGMLDERFGVGNCEDDDYCLRVMRAGYRLILHRESFVFHFGSKTFVSMGLVGASYQKRVDENVKLLLEKWEEYRNDEPLSSEYARRLNAQARDARTRGNLKEALRLLTRAVRAFRGSALNFNDLGVVLWELGEAERAVTAFEKSVELDPDYDDARENLKMAKDGQS